MNISFNKVNVSAYFCTYHNLPDTYKLEHGHIFAFRNIITIEVKGKVNKQNKQTNKKI